MEKTMQVELPLDFGGVPLRVGDQVEVMSSWGTLWEPSWNSDVQTVRHLVLHIEDGLEYWGVRLNLWGEEYDPVYLRHAEEE